MGLWGLLARVGVGLSARSGGRDFKQRAPAQERGGWWAGMGRVVGTFIEPESMCV